MSESKLSEFRERLYSLRTKKHLSRAALSQLSGVNADTINRYEMDPKRKPRIEQLRMLANALQVSAPYLMGFGNEDGSDIDLGLGELLVKELGYTPSAAKALARQIALESRKSGSSGIYEAFVTANPSEHTHALFASETAKAEADLINKTRQICESVPNPGKGSKAGDAVSAARVRTVTRFIESNSETLKVLIVSASDK